MSVRALSWAFLQKTGDPTRKIILMVLADHADERGFCYPALKTIADRSESTRRTVQRHLKALEDDGLIRREERFTDTGRQTSYMYSLPIDEPMRSTSRGGCQNSTLPPEGTRKEGVNLSPPRVSDLHGEGVTHDTPEGVTGDTPIEPSEEPSREDSLSARELESVENSDPLGELPTYTLAAIRGLYGGPGREGTDEAVWAEVSDGDDRERLLRTAAWRWLGEGHVQFNARLFRRILETVVSESRGGGGGPRASPGVHRRTYLDDDDDQELAAS